jgi:predicted ATPase
MFYGAHGYELVELPRSPVEQRVRFVLETAGIAGTAR